LISLSNIFGGFILKLLKKWDKHIITFISIIGYGLAMLLVTSFSQQIYAFGFFMLAKTSISFFVPTQMTLVNECINEKYRATTLSFYSMTTELVGGIGILFVGFMSKTWSISTSWRVFAILALFSILIYSTIISNNNSKKLEG
jgi:predicted MFS family arabinose efflux permease